MTLRILFTLAILAGLAAAPGAEQNFEWQAGRGGDAWSAQLGHRVEHLMSRLSRITERISQRVVGRVTSRMVRAANRVASRTERQADRISDRVPSRVESRIRTRIERRGADNDGLAWSDQGGIADDPCRDLDRREGDDSRHCEVRETRLPAGPLAVDANRNGGIRVEGWDGGDILVRAIVQTRAREEVEAQRMAGQVEIQTGGGRVTATGPSTGERASWSVSYRISVPRRTDLDLDARNGGITIAGVAGAITFDTTNGGVRLADLAGQVTGRTRNGGVDVVLGGSRWEGDGLDVETSNGGVTLAVPTPYDAELEMRTVNGGFRFDYPLTLTGELSPRRGISTRLGAGGPPVRVRTTNGGLTIALR